MTTFNGYAGQIFFSILEFCFLASLVCVVILMDARVVPGRVRVAVRLRPRNAEELSADSDFADCVELQPEVS